MARLLLAAFFGAAVGVVSVNALAPRGGDCEGCVAIEGSTSDERVAERLRPARIAADAADFSIRLRAYETAESATLPTLSARFTETLALPPSTERGFLLSTLIGAIAERDPDEAIDLLSRNDIDGVMARTLGVAVLDVAGITRENIDRLTGALPRIDRGRLIGDAVAELTAASPDAGVQLALEFESKVERTLALEAAAETVAEQDPYTALRLAQTIPEEPGVVFRPSRVVFQMMALRYVARASLLTAVDYVAQFARSNDSQRARNELIQVVVDEAARADPLLALEAARQLQNEQADELETAALRRLARDDPALAITYADTVAQETRRNELRRSIAEIYGEADPEAALSWVGSLEPPSPQLVLTVLEGLARADPLRAIDMLLSDETPTSRTMVRSGRGFMSSGPSEFSILGTVMGPEAQVPEGMERDDLISEIGRRLLTLPAGQQRDRWVYEYASTWARNDARSAIEWVILNGDTVQPWIYSNIAGNMRGDLTEALSLTAQIPAERRDDWVGSLASNMAQRDAAGALEWVAQLRSQPIYEAAAVSVAQSAARTDPASALALLTTLPIERQISASRSVAMNWASADPVAARAWVASLPPGAQRDAALNGLVQRGIYLGRDLDVTPPDAGLLALFSSDAARQGAMLSVIERMAETDPAAARALLDEHLTDPALRSRAEIRLRRARN